MGEGTLRESESQDGKAGHCGESQSHLWKPNTTHVRNLRRKMKAKAKLVKLTAGRGSGDRTWASHS